MSGHAGAHCRPSTWRPPGVARRTRSARRSYTPGAPPRWATRGPGSWTRRCGISRPPGLASRRVSRSARSSRADETPRPASRPSRAAPPCCTAMSSAARHAAHDRSHRRERHLPRLRLRLRRHHSRRETGSHRGRPQRLRARGRVVRRRGCSRGDARERPRRIARTGAHRGRKTSERCEAPARLSRRRRLLRNAAGRGRHRRSAARRHRQPRRDGRDGSARGPAARTRWRHPRRNPPARRPRRVLGGGPERALSAVRFPLRGGVARRGDAPGAKQPHTDRRGCGGSPRSRRGRRTGGDRVRRRSGRPGNDAGSGARARRGSGRAFPPRGRQRAGHDSSRPGPSGGARDARPGLERPHTVRLVHAPRGRQPLRRGRRAHVADRVSLRRGLRARVPNLPPAGGRSGSARRRQGGRRARHRYAGEPPRAGGHWAYPGAERRDRTAGQRGAVPARRRGGHRSGGDPRGRHRVPDGRRPAAAAAVARGCARRGRHRPRPAQSARRMSKLTRLRITGGTVYDPANGGGADGVVRDVCIEGDRIVAELPSSAPRLDARGMVVMPGGVDIHAHIAGSSVNHARRLLPEEHAADPAPAPRLDGGAVARSGTGGTLPSTFATGYRYAGLGYTTVMEAAVAPLAARHAHAELDDTPIIDAGFFVLLGNDDYLLRQLAAGEGARARDYVAWLLGTTRGYAIKIVNPGGVAVWKGGGDRRNVSGLDDTLGSSAITPRKILDALAGAANGLALPHPVHIHCNNLGQPGNAATTLESMRALSGQRAHFTHLQFHSYGGAPGKGWASAAREVIEYVNAHAEVSVDVGQVMFGAATTVTADSPVEHLLYTSSGRKWVNVDIELESGCGIVPYAYKEKAAVAALQWSVGLELFLLARDPWRVVLSTDHPNGGTFFSYPELIRLLMDRAYRDERLKRVNQKLLAGSALLDGLSREYTLGEIAIITRAGPARLLGLKTKGHLGPGADADVTIYANDADRAKMFSTPRYVIKAGTLVVEEGQLRRAPAGRRLAVRPEYDAAVTTDVKRFFDQYACVAFENYGAEPVA